MDFFAANQGKINTFQLKVAHFLNLLFERDGIAVADPGFPVGGRGSRRGAWTPKGVTFRKFCMSQCKNPDTWEGGTCAGHAPSRSANGLTPVNLIKRTIFFLPYMSVNLLATP